MLWSPCPHISEPNSINFKQEWPSFMLPRGWVDSFRNVSLYGEWKWNGCPLFICKWTKKFRKTTVMQRVRDESWIDPGKVGDGSRRLLSWLADGSGRLLVRWVEYLCCFHRINANRLEKNHSSVIIYSEFLKPLNWTTRPGLSAGRVSPGDRPGLRFTDLAPPFPALLH